MKHITITWLDSHSWSNGWMRLSDALEKIRGVRPINSTGYVLKEDEEYIYIAQNENEDNVSNIYAIPKRSIKESRVISAAVVLSLILSATALYLSIHPSQFAIHKVIDAISDDYSIIIQ